MKKATLMLLFLINVLLVSCSEDAPTGPDDPVPPAGIVGDTTKPPEITIVGLQPGDSYVSGTANNLDTSKTNVVLWAKTDHWYVQPYVTQPFTPIQGTGHWGNTTHPWNRLVALLVDATYDPGSIRLEHPSGDPGILAWDEYPEPKPDRIIDWKGHTWKVKNASLAGPGPNYFSDDQENVWLENGQLRLAITQRNGNWYCGEVYLEHSLGYGSYTFQLDSRVDSLDYNAIFAGFIYENTDQEADIEWSLRLSSPHNAQYVIQPWHHPGNIYYWDMPAVQQTTHQFIWTEDYVEFISWTGWESEPTDDNVIAHWIYEGPDVPLPGNERMRFNLWLFNGGAPQSGQGDQVTINSFYHQAVAPAGILKSTVH